MHRSILFAVFALTVVHCYGSVQVQMPETAELQQPDDDLQAQIKDLQKNVSDIWTYIFELRSAVSHHLTHLRKHQAELESSMHKMEHLHESELKSSGYHHSGEQHSHSGEHHSHSSEHSHGSDHSHGSMEGHSHSGEHPSHSGEHHSHSGEQHSHSGEHHSHDDDHGHHSHGEEHGHHSHGEEHGHHSHSVSHSHTSHDHSKEDSHSHTSHDHSKEDSHSHGGHDHKDSHETEDLQQQTQQVAEPLAEPVAVPVAEPVVTATNRQEHYHHHHRHRQSSRSDSTDRLNLLNENSYHHHHHHDHQDQSSRSRNRTVELPRYSDYGVYDLAMCRVSPNTAIPDDQQQNIAGAVTLWQKKSGGPLNIHVRLQGFEVGDHHAHHQQSVQVEDNETPQAVGHRHGFHIHAFGDLSNGCQSAGPHYNPKGVNHGGPNSLVRHVGDLGNIECDEHGNTNILFSDDLASLTGQYSIIGKAIVIHAKEDDLGLGGDDESLRTGNAGTRLACCVIQRVDKIPIRQYRAMKAAVQFQNR